MALHFGQLCLLSGSLSWPSRGTLAWRDPQRCTDPAPAVNQVRSEVLGRELSCGPYQQGTCSSRSQQCELPRLSPSCQHPGCPSSGGTNPKPQRHFVAFFSLTPPASSFYQVLSILPAKYSWVHPPTSGLPSSTLIKATIILFFLI